MDSVSLEGPVSFNPLIVFDPETPLPDDPSRGRCVRQFVLSKQNGLSVKQTEQYLHDEVPCGVPGCVRCLREVEGLKHGSKDDVVSHPSRRVSRVLVCSYNVCAESYGFLESDPSVLEPGVFLVVPYSVRDQLRKDGKKNALDRLSSIPVERLWFFPDVFCRSCANSPGVESVEQYYETHLNKDGEGESVRVSIMQDSSSLAEFAEESKAPGAGSFLQDFAEARCSETRNGDVSGSNPSMYEEYLSEAEADELVKSGKAIEGLMRMAPGSELGVAGSRVLVDGPKNLNRAVDGDIVVVRILSKAEADADGTVNGGVDGPVANDPEGVLESLPAEVLPESAYSLKGSVVCIKRRRVSSFIATITEESAKTRDPSLADRRDPSLADRRDLSLAESDYYLAYPMDARLPVVKLKTKSIDFLLNQRLVVSMDSWAADSEYPVAKYTRVVGKMGEIEVESECILISNRVPHRGAVGASDFKEQWVAHEDPDLENRIDLRSDGTIVVSIDPPGCKDIDDALSCSVDPNNPNLWIVGVHIADVSHFVKENTEVDRIARERGSTIYLVEKRTDMLPSELTTSTCSLVGGVDRFAFSAFFTFSKSPVEADGTQGNSEPSRFDLVDTRFAKTVIRSKAALTYEQAQRLLESARNLSAGKLNASDSEPVSKKAKKDKVASSVEPPVPDMSGSQVEIASAISRLDQVAKYLRGERMTGGSLEFFGSELRFELSGSLDCDQMPEISMSKYQSFETNKLVEEFMIYANMAVATYLVEKLPASALVRKHPEMNVELLKDLQGKLAHLKIGNKPFAECSVEEVLTYFKSKNAESLPTSSNKATASGSASVSSAVSGLMTRCMNQAIYVPAKLGALRHTGLALERYTHFTSPIRRYADLVVHRQLFECLRAAGGRANDADMKPDIDMTSDGAASYLSTSLAPSACLDATYVRNVCQNLNTRTRSARICSRQSQTLFAYFYLSKNKAVSQTVFEGFVTRVPNQKEHWRKGTVDISVPQLGMEVVNVSTGPNSQSSGASVKLLDRVKLRVFARNSDGRLEVSGEIVSA